MRFSAAVSGLALLNLLVGGQSTGAKKQKTKFYSKMSKQSEVEFDAAKGSWIKKMDPDDFNMPDGTPGPIMAFAVIHLEPGHVRDMHWHLDSDEWIYITEGTCQFTLMDSAGRYSLFEANKGDIAFFRKNWSHSFQAINKKDGCSALLWFDKSDVTIDVTPVIGLLDTKVLRQHLNNIPEDKLDSMRFPLYDPKDVQGETGVVAGEIKNSRRLTGNREKAGGENKNKNKKKKSDSLVLFPVISVKDGDLSKGADGSAREYRIDTNNFPISQTMSGGVVFVEEGAVRELHWHPNSEEHIYVLEGKIEVTVLGIGHDNRKYAVETFQLTAGDLVVFPEGYIHAFEAIGGDATCALMFNIPSWESQSLSTSFAVTPKHITATTLDTTEKTVDEYFPSKSLGGVFFPPSDD